MPTLRDFSVKFGRDPRQGLYSVKAIPFLYSLINHNDSDETIGIDSYGVLCKADAITSHYVRLDPDYNYKLIAIKYSTYYNNRGRMEWYENSNTAAVYLPDVFPGTSYNQYIQVSLSVLGSGSQTLFGGQNVQSINDGAAKIPMAISSMQGYEYGFQALRCEYLVPMQGIFSFEFTNTHKTKDIYVAACMYGMKIRL
jgi:hypothetical protein